jgi:putative transposase
MPTGLKRYYGLRDLHFLTFSCYGRLPLLRTAGARNLFVRALGVMRERHGFLLVGYVVMPEHVHLLIGEPPRGRLSTVLQALKQRVSRDLREETRRASSGQSDPTFPNGGRRLPRFWQVRFYDFNVYSAGKRREKLDYMHANPVKRGLVEDPSVWIWSSAGFYVKGDPGLVPIDPVP